MSDETCELCESDENVIFCECEGCRDQEPEIGGRWLCEACRN